MPQVHVNIRKRVTSIGINQLEVHEKRNTSLILDNVLTNELTRDIYVILVN
jgi:hypothetical protein